MTRTIMNPTLIRSIFAHRGALRIQRSLAVPRTRYFVTTSASQLQPSQTVLLSSPSSETIEDQELDVELIPPQAVAIGITQRAAEQLRQISIRENNPDAALRIAVESGGCHGYQYKLDLAPHPAPGDYHLSHPTLKPSNIIVDAVSMSLLNGSSIDFATELIGSSFRVLNNPHASGSGCGCGVSWELKS